MSKSQKIAKPALTFEQLAAQSYKEWQARMAAPPADSSAKRALRKLGIKMV